jgi:hypothetical protein
LKRSVLSLVAVGLFCVASSVAAAPHPHAESDALVGGSKIHQEITVWGADTIHYWIVVRDPAGVGPFCMTFQFERKSAAGWRRAGGKNGRDRACCPQPTPDEACASDPTVAAWDLFLTPGKRLIDDVRSGSLRMHGSTDLGASIVLRLDGPVS